jgi:hypothetical protein
MLLYQVIGYKNGCEQDSKGKTEFWTIYQIGSVTHKVKDSNLELIDKPSLNCIIHICEPN